MSEQRQRNRNERSKASYGRRLAATRAAVEEGIIAGGGSAYIHANWKAIKTVAEADCKQAWTATRNQVLKNHDA